MSSDFRRIPTDGLENMRRDRGLRRNLSARYALATRGEGRFPVWPALTGSVCGRLELVGIAVGEVPHAVFEAGLGDRFLEVLQG